MNHLFIFNKKCKNINLFLWHKINFKLIIKNIFYKKIIMILINNY